MPAAPVPPELDGFLAQPNRAVVATLRADGSPHTVATWYLWEDGRALLNMLETSVRVRHIRRDPRVALTVLGEDWTHHVSLVGRVVDIHVDRDGADVDRLSYHYEGRPWSGDRRGVSAWLVPERWHGWAGSIPLAPAP